MKQRNFTLDEDSEETLWETIAEHLVSTGRCATPGEARQAIHDADDYERIRGLVDDAILSLAGRVAREWGRQRRHEPREETETKPEARCVSGGMGNL
jgi:hypothetical protein